MRATDLLLNLVVVVVALGVYHVFFAPAPAEPIDGSGVEDGADSGGRAGLGAGEVERTLRRIDERLTALESSGATDAPRRTERALSEGDIEYWQEVLKEIRSREAAARDRVRHVAVVRRLHPDISEQDLERAVDMIQAFYADVRRLYAEAGPLDADSRRAVQLQVDQLIAQAETDLRTVLPDEVVAKIRGTLPGGSRPAVTGTDPGPGR